MVGGISDYTPLDVFKDLDNWRSERLAIMLVVHKCEFPNKTNAIAENF